MQNVKSVTLALLLVVSLVAGLAPASAADGSASQQRAAEEYLAALARGDAQAMAASILDEELVQLRRTLLEAMKLEADRNGSLTRSRLFGEGMSLADIERLTPQNFFVTLSSRLRFSGREFKKIDWVGALKDRGGMVQMVGRLIPRDDMGEVRVPVVVSILPWGSDWKAAMPLELQAQIDDLRAGRTRVPRPAVAGPVPPAAVSTLPKGMVELFDTALANLGEARCEAYYDKQMSPNFRRTTGTRALRTLITACESRAALREQYITAIRLAREREPRYEYAGTRAVFDIAGTGLPFSRWIVEQVDERWYIAE